jgi:hypothetical protein
MNRTHFRTASVPCMVLLLLTVAGCVSPTPNLDRHFGESVNLVKAQQTLYPEASRNTDPVKGIDGKAAKSAYDEYQKSYRVPEPQPNAFMIGVGGR